MNNNTNKYFYSDMFTMGTYNNIFVFDWSHSKPYYYVLKRLNIKLCHTINSFVAGKHTMVCLKMDLIRRKYVFNILVSGCFKIFKKY